MPISDESVLDTVVSDHITGAETVDTTGYTDIVGVRRDNIATKESEGFEVIADSDQDMVLMGKPIPKKRGRKVAEAEEVVEQKEPAEEVKADEVVEAEEV